jgi:hypothetical protein
MVERPGRRLNEALKLLRMTEKELHSAQVAGLATNLAAFGRRIE